MDWADESADEAIKQSSHDDGDSGYEVSVKILRLKIADVLRAERAISDKQAETLRMTCGNLRILVLAKDKRIAELEAEIESRIPHYTLKGAT